MTELNLHLPKKKSGSDGKGSPPQATETTRNLDVKDNLAHPDEGLTGYCVLNLSLTVEQKAKLKKFSASHVPYKSMSKILWEGFLLYQEKYNNVTNT